MTTRVDDLIRDFGEVVVAADAAHADQLARRAIEAAIWEATSAIGATIKQPDSPVILSLAEDVLRRTASLISALECEFVRSRRNASIAADRRLERSHRKARLTPDQ